MTSALPFSGRAESLASAQSAAGGQWDEDSHVPERLGGGLQVRQRDRFDDGGTGLERAGLPWDTTTRGDFGRFMELTKRAKADADETRRRSSRLWERTGRGDGGKACRG